jgi:type IV secretion system protein VirD4
MIALLWAMMCRGALLLAGLVMVATGAALFIHFPQFGLVLAAFTVWRICRRRSFGGWVHGTARLAGWAELARGFLGRDGLILGTTGYLDPPTRRFAFGQLLTAPLTDSGLVVRLVQASIFRRAAAGDQVIRVNDACHLATFARTRGGKGVSVVIPTLLSYPGSMVVLDTKKENYTITHKHRKRRFKNRIVLLAPFDAGSDTFNPLDLIDHNAPDFIDQTRDLAAAMIVRTGRETENHFIDSAERVLQAVIAFVCVTAEPEQRHLQSVREILASRTKYDAVVKTMQLAGDVAGGMLQRLGGGLTWHEGKEQASVMSTVQRMTGWLDSPAIAANTVRSSFDVRQLKTGRMTIYLNLPPERIQSHAAVQRMWISSILRAITPGADERRKVLFLLDEIGNMGHLQILEDAVTLYAGFGIRLWFIFQSLDQVRKCFGDNAPTILDNIGTQQYFGINSFETAEAISKKLGDATELSVSEQEGWNDGRTTGAGPHPQSSNTGSSRSVTTTELSRKLLKPEEIIKLPDDLCIILHLNHLPILARRIKYYNSPLFRWGRTGSSPRGAGLAAGLLAAAMLVSSVGLAAVAAVLPALVPRLQLNRAMIGRPVSRPGLPGGSVTPLPYRGGQPANRRPPLNRQGRNPGFGPGSMGIR